MKAAKQLLSVVCFIGCLLFACLLSLMCGQLIIEYLDNELQYPAYPVLVATTIGFLFGILWGGTRR